MIHIIGSICFFVSLSGALYSVFAEIPIWFPLIMFLLSVGLSMYFRQYRGIIWFILSISQSMVWLIGSYLFLQWGDSRWSLFVLKFAVLLLLAISWVIGLLIWRLTSITKRTQINPVKSQETIWSRFSKLFKKNESPKNAITFVLGEKVEEKGGIPS